jgi:flagellar basal-body rod protein FlgG
MNRAMIAAASGMSIEEANLEQISENVANAENPGYKSSDIWVSALNSGLGAQVGGTRLNLSQGKLEKSGGPFDLAITGPGFFKVSAPNGDIAYSRLGDFSRNPDGKMVNGQGCTLDGVSIPENATDVKVTPDGKILATVNGNKDFQIGHISLAAFAAPDKLRQTGIKGVFMATAASGVSKDLTPGGDTKISFGMLEKSNISIVESMLSLLAAQRAYEADSKGVQSADEMLRIANSLQKS